MTALNLRAITRCLTAGLCFSVLVACKKGGDSGGGPPEVAMEVVIEKPSVTVVEDILSAVGSIEANERVELKPKTSGLIESIHFTEGQRVKKGNKLFDLDLRKETATVAQAEAEAKLANANVTRARALLGSKAISQQEVEQLESQVAVKSATRAVEQEHLSERSLSAPFDGVIGARLVSPGQYVNAGTALAVLVDDATVKVNLRVPERNLVSIRVGQQGRLRIGAFPDRQFTGKVDLISPEVEEATRTAQVRLIVPNPEGVLKAGMFARVDLVTARREKAVVIPEGALVPSIDQFSVYVVETNVARLRPIVLGVRLPGKIEVRSGLTAEQPIVVTGTQKLVEGMKVVAAQTNALPNPAR